MEPELFVVDTGVRAIPTTFGTKISTDAFYRRLTVSEMTRIELASTDPGVDGPQRNMAALLRVNTRRLSGAAYFDLTSEANITAVSNMALANLLDPPQHGAATRAEEILSTPVVDPEELPGSIRVSYGLPEIPR